ncbi:zinc-responsive transcriptional regulator ZAP1 [Colletotrichum spaethianum]|uniref:Zinc-responsive transcriptional regulator ZAP1 n=1 Tax=Colletotrichum spaethianum TaxID=700344 RepID=A0AA37LDD7_9PEZI|nr:zinc-responsive transcriptional regulator ZAP1 [Colletotrichum spaethianum]GKT43930.1 zinc-responsive transcriptional regulator ZAP1 [Colletotrichum spaethianum]
MEATELDNDTRGWIMCIVSGIACVVGASIICVDLLVRYIPGKRNFRIQDSNGFLACSLSLSFGVMLYSALNSMLPSAKQYLKEDGFQDQLAGFLMMACFIGGFVGIQVISRLLHQYMPSHVVDCDHTHDHSESDARSRSQSRKTSLYTSSRRSSRRPLLESVAKNGHATESTPLLNGGVAQENGAPLVAKRHASSRGNLGLNTGHSTPARTSRSRGPTVDRRPSMAQVQQRVMSFVKDTKTNCDEEGPCFGYTDPCGQECFKHLSNRSLATLRHPTMLRKSTGSFYAHSHADLEDLEEGGSSCDSPISGNFPEGFITYATNHANPTLGFNVFMALFVHNITEGFAMALPLYMALGSRMKAMFWAAVLGGLSQPLGAGVAVLWFKLAKHTHLTPNAVAYACMFAITAGIMVSVGLQLFVEALGLNHNRNLCIFFGFMGMALLGITSAIASTH